jgi:hypothetical protein
MFKTILAGLAVLILFLSLIFGLNLFGLANYGFFAPKYRAVDAEVFKQSEQYNDGMIRDLENLQMEYMQADQAHKDALRSIIIHRFEVYDQNRLTPSLWNFYQQVRQGKL